MSRWMALRCMPVVALMGLGCSEPVAIGSLDAGEHEGGEVDSGDRADAVGPDAGDDASTSLLEPSPLGCSAETWAEGWSAQGANPVLTIEHGWESWGIHPASVRPTENGWSALYVGRELLGCTSGGISRDRTIGRLGVMASDDGRTWRRGSPEPRFDLFLDCADGRTLRYGREISPRAASGAAWAFWFSADEAIHVARSDDGHRYPILGAPVVLGPGAPGTYDDVRVDAPNVFDLPAHPPRMVYGAVGGGELQLASLAVAELDGETWRRVGDGPFAGGTPVEPPPGNDGGPIVHIPDGGSARADGGDGDAGTGSDAGDAGAEGEASGLWKAADPSVLAFSDCVVAAFTRMRTPRVFETPATIGIATSPDGLTWTVAEEPALAPRAPPPGATDPPELGHPALFVAEDAIGMLFQGVHEWETEDAAATAIGVAWRPLP